MSNILVIGIDSETGQQRTYAVGDTIINTVTLTQVKAIAIAMAIALGGEEV